MSIAVTLARRNRAQRLVRARIVARLEAFARPATTPAGTAPTATTGPIVAAAERADEMATGVAGIARSALRLDPPGEVTSPERS
jgi:hypothetical protein